MRPTSFGTDWTGDDPFAAHVYKGKVAAATHGGLPFRDPTTLVLFGPGVPAGAALDHCQIVDTAPTIAAGRPASTSTTSTAASSPS